MSFRPARILAAAAVSTLTVSTTTVLFLILPDPALFIPGPPDPQVAQTAPVSYIHQHHRTSRRP